VHPDKPGRPRNDRAYRNPRTSQPLTPDLDNGPGSDKQRCEDVLLQVVPGERRRHSAETPPLNAKPAAPLLRRGQYKAASGHAGLRVNSRSRASVKVRPKPSARGGQHARTFPAWLDRVRPRYVTSIEMGWLPTGARASALTSAATSCRRLDALAASTP
jgi:hypothetical protein